MRIIQKIKEKFMQMKLGVIRLKRIDKLTQIFVIKVKPDSMGQYPSIEERKKMSKEYKELLGNNVVVITDLVDIFVANK